MNLGSIAMYLHSGERITGDNKRCNKQESSSIELNNGKIFDGHSFVDEIIWHWAKSCELASEKYLSFVETIMSVLLLDNMMVSF